MSVLLKSKGFLLQDSLSAGAERKLANVRQVEVFGSGTAKRHRWIDPPGTLHSRRKSARSSGSGSAELLRATTHSPRAPLDNFQAEDINLLKLGAIFSWMSTLTGGD